MRLALFAFLAAASALAEDTARVLERQTQELYDAIATGQASVWDRYLDPRAVITSEDGERLPKSALIAQIKPLPAGVSGKIQVTDFQATVDGTLAVATHVEDESENYHGHQLHCQYRTTDTWIRTDAGWRLLASQILALRTDPPAVPLTPEQAAAYVGRYELSPGITYEIHLKAGGEIEGQQTGRKPEALRAEALDVLFVPGRPRYRKIFQRDAAGRVVSFADRREAWDLAWKRMKP